MGVRIIRDDDADPPTITAAGAGDVAVATLHRGGWILEDDGASDRTSEVLTTLARETAGSLQWWVEPADARSDSRAADAGMAADRDLLQLRRPLPHDRHAEISTRSFRPGDDDEAWLAVNNRAFAWHEDQSDWEHADLEARMGEAWFDPEGFRVHESSGRIAAFCWTRVHLGDPPLGEIHVIAVDPDLAGRGLGRQVTLAGLDHLAGRGMSIAMLYVEADNAAGLGLYEGLGFAEHHVRRRYRPVGSPYAASSTPMAEPTA